MAIHIHCPQCHQRLDTVQETCTHCGSDLPIGVLYALSAALGKTPLPSPAPAGRLPPHLARPKAASPSALPAPSVTLPAAHSRLRPWLAALLSLFGGLGQFYNGQVRKGCVLIALGAVAVLGFAWLPGKFLLLFVWLYSIVDAFLVAYRRRVPTSPRLASPPPRQ